MANNDGRRAWKFSCKENNEGHWLSPCVRISCLLHWLSPWDRSRWLGKVCPWSLWVWRLGLERSVQKNLENGEEVVTYQVPLPWAAKYGVISILRKFEAEFGCRLTVRGRSGEAKKKIKLGTENKIYFLHLKLVDGLGDNRSAETRRSCLSEAELHLDAFVRLVVRSPRDNVYMFPPEGQNEQPAPGASPARTFVVVEKVGPTCRFQ